MSRPDRIPATIVTGFLGAGKTTLIRNLLLNARGKRIALIVNEFGDMGFDGGLLADCGDDSCKPDQIVELTNGCICCTVADEFLPTMEMLLARDPAPDHIVIETSGLALPQPLVRAFGWPSVRHRVTVDGVVTVVDAEAVAAGRLAPDPEAVAAAMGDGSVRDHDNPVEEVFDDQIACADLVVLSKSERLGAAALADARRRVAGESRAGVRLLLGTAAGLPASVLLGLGAEAENDLAARPSQHEAEGDEHDHDDFESFVAGPAVAGSLAEVEGRVAAAMALPGVLRIKGRMRVAGKAAPAVVQAVGGRVETYFAPGAGAPGLVVIGERGLDQAAIGACLDGAAGDASRLG